MPAIVVYDSELEFRKVAHKLLLERGVLGSKLLAVYKPYAVLTRVTNHIKNHIHQMLWNFHVDRCGVPELDDRCLQR